ncbi:hypothetical protein, partial [Streptococcus mitis]|uniref:hypothetical protein n=1 Tax=Streptococcus mitis TaxID=28037 RepID=UPI0021B8354E
WAQTWHCSLGHVEAASHMPQLEGPTTRRYNYVLGGFEEKRIFLKRLATGVSSGPIFLTKKKKLYAMLGSKYQLSDIFCSD